MSLLSKFILDLEESGYYLRVNLKETLQFAKGSYEKNYRFLINKISLNTIFSGESFTVYKFFLNKNMKVSTFDNIVDSVVRLRTKEIGVSIDTHRYRRKDGDIFHFRSRPLIYDTIPKQLLIDKEEQVLSDFRNCLCELTEETNCNFYAEPWKAFKLLT